MRFFIALEIPKQNLPEFQSIQTRLHTLIPQAKLTDVDKIHLTLAFVGEQDEGLKEDLIEVIASSINGIPAFAVTPAYIDGFPQIHHPEVLWVGVKGDIDKIHIIRERIKDSLETLRLSVDERRFVPHISIAKLNHNFQLNRNVEAELEEMMASNFDPIQISSIKLFESMPEGPARNASHSDAGGGLHQHNTLAEIKLF